LKGEHIITENTLIFGLDNIGGYRNCFKLVGLTSSGVEKELIMYADAPNIKMKWMYAIESYIMESKQLAERTRLSKQAAKRSSRNVNPDMLSRTFAGFGAIAKELNGNEEAASKALDSKAKAMITIAEKFIRAWMEGDDQSFSSTLTASKYFYIIKYFSYFF
jgi:hypothetical protein